MKDVSLADLSSILEMAAANIKVEADLAVLAIATEIRESAKEKIGHYQGASHGFAAWAPLTQATMDQRVRLGYSANNPLERSGELRDSISMRVDGNGAIIGTSMDIGLYMENGTEKSPPRPYLGPAAAEVSDRLGEIFSPHVRKAFKR
ncbi:phage virion morphogenesis protein [Enterobacter cloacae complex sp. 2024EL-00215]|uniref:phage virion morphogenesis protein n=1 Tax=unclassified Enterobacter cloacae complex TaxID=2757714 RepID=UPI003750D5CA